MQHFFAIIVTHCILIYVLTDLVVIISRYIGKTNWFMDILF